MKKFIIGFIILLVGVFCLSSLARISNGIYDNFFSDDSALDSTGDKEPSDDTGSGGSSSSGGNTDTGTSDGNTGDDSSEDSGSSEETGIVDFSRSDVTFGYNYIVYGSYDYEISGNYYYYSIPGTDWYAKFRYKLGVNQQDAVDMFENPYVKVPGQEDNLETFMAGNDSFLDYSAYARAVRCAYLYNISDSEYTYRVVSYPDVYDITYNNVSYYLYPLDINGIRYFIKCAEELNTQANYIVSYDSRLYGVTKSTSILGDDLCSYVTYSSGYTGSEDTGSGDSEEEITVAYSVSTSTFNFNYEIDTSSYDNVGSYYYYAVMGTEYFVKTTYQLTASGTYITDMYDRPYIKSQGLETKSFSNIITLENGKFSAELYSSYCCELNDVQASSKRFLPWGYYNTITVLNFDGNYYPYIVVDNIYYFVKFDLAPSGGVYYDVAADSRLYGLTYKVCVNDGEFSTYENTNIAGSIG